MPAITITSTECWTMPKLVLSTRTPANHHHQRAEQEMQPRCTRPPNPYADVVPLGHHRAPTQPHYRPSFNSGRRQSVVRIDGQRDSIHHSGSPADSIASSSGGLGLARGMCYDSFNSCKPTLRSSEDTYNLLRYIYIGLILSFALNIETNIWR